MVKEGIIIFLKQNIGSKSEGVYPFLYVSFNEIIRVYKIDDNPLSNESFFSFDAKTVRLKGTLKDSYFEVAQIVLLNENNDKLDEKRDSD